MRIFAGVPRGAGVKRQWGGRRQSEEEATEIAENCRRRQPHSRTRVVDDDNRLSRWLLLRLFLPRDALVQSAVLRSQVVRPSGPSVCLSVTFGGSASQVGNLGN